MDRKELFVFSILAIIFISGSVNQSQPSEIEKTEHTNQFLTYDSSAYGIRIEYPSDWIKSEESMESVVTFLSPKENASDIFQENLNVVVQDLSAKPMTLSEYTDLGLNQASELITDLNIIDSIATTLAGYPAHKVILTGKYSQYHNSMKWMQVFTIKNNKAYLITYTAEVGKYSDFLETIQQMVNSFEIIDTKQTIKVTPSVGYSAEEVTVYRIQNYVGLIVILIAGYFGYKYGRKWMKNKKQ